MPFSNKAMALRKVLASSLPRAAVAGGAVAGVAAFSIYHTPKNPLTCFAEDVSLARLSYTSSVRGDSWAAKQQVQKILDTSHQNDPSSGISGNVCYDEQTHSMWQMLEGKPNVVEEVWNTISKDEHHIIDSDTVTLETVHKRKYSLHRGLRLLIFGAEEDLEACDATSSAGPERLIQITYKSVMKDRGGGEKNIVNHDIVPQAAESNKQLKVTGWMLYNDLNLTVYQVLEGPADVVQNLFEVIKNDDRHVVCESSIRTRSVKKREFPDWSMELDKVEQSCWNAQGY